MMNTYCLEAAQYIDNTYRYWCYQHAVAENRSKDGANYDFFGTIIFLSQLFDYRHIQLEEEHEVLSFGCQRFDDLAQ